MHTSNQSPHNHGKPPELQRNCLNCKEPLRGRADKKFCNDYCRSSYNNTNKTPTRQLKRRINNALRKNRQILRKKLGEQAEAKVPKEDLRKVGFNFNYLTRYAKNDSGFFDLFCFEYKYSFDNNICIITREERFFDEL